MWCRLFDAIASDRILQEAESVNKLMKKVDNNELEIIGSIVMMFEVSMILDNLKRTSVKKLIARAATEISPVIAGTKGLAGAISIEKSAEVMEKTFTILKQELNTEGYLIYFQVITPGFGDQQKNFGRRLLVSVCKGFLMAQSGWSEKFWVRLMLYSERVIMHRAFTGFVD